MYVPIYHQTPAIITMNQPIQLIVGLGNPGNQYQHTRHNVGQWLVEAIADNNHLSLRNEAKFYGRYAKERFEQHAIHLLIPTTYMNNSGQSVNAVAKFFKILPEQILIIYDDLDLPCGKSKLKPSGGHGGHNGIRDIINHLGSKNFPRLRLGIGHPGHKDLVLNYVLGTPKKSEKEKILAAITDAQRIIPQLIAGNWDKAVQQLHS